MAKKIVIRFSSSLPYLNIYPSDLEDIINMDGEMYIQTTWGADIRGQVTATEDGYKIFLARGEDTIEETIKKTDAVTIFTGKAFNIKLLNPPFDLRNKIPFALGINREKRMNSLDELYSLYKEQTIVHDKALLGNLVNNDRAYIPVRFDFGIMHIVVICDGYGQYNLADGFYYMDGFPSTEDAIAILDNVPAKYVDIRRINWMKTLIRLAAEDSENRKSGRQPERSYPSRGRSQDDDEEERERNRRKRERDRDRDRDRGFGRER